MKRFSWGGLFVAGLGALVILTPYMIFPVCDKAITTTLGGSVPMQCFWTARAALGSGGMILFSGMALLFISNPGVRVGVTLPLFCLGFFTAFTAHTLIGVCPGEMMPCHMGTLPALLLLGLATMLAAAAIAFQARKNMPSSTLGHSLSGRRRSFY